MAYNNRKINQPIKINRNEKDEIIVNRDIKPTTIIIFLCLRIQREHRKVKL